MDRRPLIEPYRRTYGLQQTVVNSQTAINQLHRKTVTPPPDPPAILVALLTASVDSLSSVASLSVSVGTSDGTVADVGGSFNQTTLNNNFRDVADKINELITLGSEQNELLRMLIAKQNEVLQTFKRGTIPK